MTCAAPAFAAPYVIPVSIAAGPLPDALLTLERQTGIELLFDRAIVNGLQSPAISGNFTADAALSQLLADSGLSARRAQSGAWIVERPSAPPLARPDAEVPEILVVGQRTQNADIRRFEDDVQPYTIATKAKIAGAHRNDVDQYFTSRVSSNTQVVPNGLARSGDTTSQIDLRGLGSQNTLVLVDGRRMPSIPRSYTGFSQSDINGIPLHAIERIEVLTGAAGGIYGFGALGGVVNVVLDRETRGVDLYLTEGISSRGDGHRQAVEARFGHTSRDGATDLMLFASHSQEDAVLVGEREYASRDRQQTFKVAPQDYNFPVANSVTVRSFLRLDPVTGQITPNPNLVFKPQFGGGALSSNHTYLPAGFSGDADALTASLTQHAGQTDLTPTSVESRGDLGSNPRSDALLANIRHRFGAGVEVYADAMILRSHGDSRSESPDLAEGGRALISPDSPANPFTDFISVYFPINGNSLRVQQRIRNTRYTGGLAAELPFDWRGTAEISAGAFHRSMSTSRGDAGDAANLLLLGDPSDLDKNPLGNWDAFQRAIAANAVSGVLTELHTRFRDQSLRLAGPVFSTAAGPSTLTLLAEHRAEDVPGFTQYSVTTDDEGMTTLEPTPVSARSTATTSFYAELRPRLFGEVAPAPILRGLELQLAVRHDAEKDDFARDPLDTSSELIHAKFAGTAYTAGAKVSPAHWLTVRGSYATGEQPPVLNELAELVPQTVTSSSVTDPKRGDTTLGADGAYLLRYGGNASLKSARATTASLGTIVTPSGKDGPRFAVDYSRVHRTRDLVRPDPAEILAHEDTWSGRIERAALTDADRANGYTAGRLTLLDTRIGNGGSVIVDALDMHASWPLPLFGGRLELYADATYHIRDTQKAPFQPDVESAGYRQGPLKWRANGGFDWSTERVTLGANLQYFASYLVLMQGTLSAQNGIVTEVQGSRSIPPQSYLDLHASWRVPGLDFGPLGAVAVELGIVNVLDKAPPREASFIDLGPGYSRYGDPRQRRFELGLSAHF
jgi:iron complex outermembrane recepter protein